MTIKKHLPFLSVLFTLTILLGGCSLTNGQEEEIAEHIDLAEWPTSVPTEAPVSPTPFPKMNFDPTATPTPLPAATITPTPVAEAVETEIISSDGAATDALVAQIAALTGGLSPVAVALTVDEVTIRQGPGGGYGAAGSLERSSVIGILGTNPAVDWLYVINTSLLYGWVPAESLRITGSLAGAPVLPADPITALLTQLASSSASSGSDAAEAASSPSSAQNIAVADLESVTTARVNNDVLNMRQRPGATFNLLTTLSRDDEVAVLALNKDKLWALVETTDGQPGWVSVEFLSIDSDLSDIPQVLSLTPGGDYPADQVAPIAMALGQAVPVAVVSNVSAVSEVTTAAVATAAQPTVPVSVLAPVASGQINHKVDLQRGPDASSGLLDTLTLDEKVSALAVNEQRDWVVVQADRSRVGWLPVDSLAVEEGSLANAYPVITAWVQSNEVDVLSGPGIFHETVGTLAINDLVAVLARNEGGNWVLIETRAGGRGWMTPKFLTIVGAALADVPLVNSLTFETPPPVESAPAPSAPQYPAQNLIALQLSSGGDIMLINADGSGLRRLTNGIDPVLSPDGQTVAFTRWDDNESGSLWTINVDGTNERFILGEMRKAKGPDWSADGSQIILNYQHGGRLKPKSECHSLLDGELPLPPMNAYDFRMVVKKGIPYFCWTLPPDPFWALRLVNLTDGSSKNVDGGTYAFRPTWDPSRNWRVVSDGGRGLLGVDINRPEYRETLTENIGDSSPVFSPDGRFLAVAAGHQSGGSYELYRMNADGTGRTRLTNTPMWVPVGPDEQKPWNNVAPAWSPDGSQIAFLTDRAGRWEIWVMGADGSNQRPMFLDAVNNQLDIIYDFVDERVLSWR
ncbi:SH3 domain-containing protein [Chloroflexota bacterium]